MISANSFDGMERFFLPGFHQCFHIQDTQQVIRIAENRGVCPAGRSGFCHGGRVGETGFQVFIQDRLEFGRFVKKKAGSALDSVFVPAFRAEDQVRHDSGRKQGADASLCEDFRIGRGAEDREFNYEIGAGASLTMA